MNYRETLEKWIKGDSFWYPTIKEAIREALADIRGLKTEMERLRAALEGQPVIESEWQQLVGERDEAREEGERLKVENRGHLANNENLAGSCKQYERRAVRAEAEVEARNADLRRVAKALGIETPLQLTALAETDEETTADLLVKHAQNTKVEVERLKKQVEFHGTKATEFATEVERLRAELELSEGETGSQAAHVVQLQAKIDAALAATEEKPTLFADMLDDLENYNEGWDDCANGVVKALTGGRE